MLRVPLTAGIREEDVRADEAALDACKTTEERWGTLNALREVRLPCKVQCGEL